MANERTECAVARPAQAKNQVHVRRTQPSETREVMAWIAARHYTGSTPPSCRVALEFFDAAGDRIGAMLIGRPASRGIDSTRVVELTRVYFIDETEPYVESHCLSVMRRFVRTWLPEVRLILSYSDEGHGHKGKIYEADGWAPFGMTTHKSGTGWGTRPGRAAVPVTPKQRWVRTP